MAYKKNITYYRIIASSIGHPDFEAELSEYILLPIIKDYLPAIKSGRISKVEIKLSDKKKKIKG